MAYTVKDTQQVFVGYKTATPPSVAGDVNVITDSEKGISIQFVNAKAETVRTDIIKNGQVKYIKAKVGYDPSATSDLSDNLYTHTVQIVGNTINGTANSIVDKGVYVLNVVVPDFFPTNVGAVKTITATYVANSSDTCATVATELDTALKNHNDYGTVFTSSVLNDTISITEVFYKDLFKLGITPVVNLIKRLKITTKPVYDQVNEEYFDKWATVTKNAKSTSANNALYKLQEMEWLLNGYKSDMMKHMNDFYNYIVPQPELMITSPTTLPAGVSDFATLDIHYEELGDGSILSQKNLLIIAPKTVVNTIGGEFKNTQGVDYTALP